MPKRRVLIVDDNHGATQLLALLLQKLGDHDISVAHNGEEALQQARQCRPDIIILDIGLPGMNGYEVAERLRQQPEFEQTLLVALTGYGQAEDRRRALEAGFDEHLVKPPPLKVLKRLFSHPKLPAAVPHD